MSIASSTKSLSPAPARSLPNPNGSSSDLRQPGSDRQVLQSCSSIESGVPLSRRRCAELDFLTLHVFWLRWCSRGPTYLRSSQEFSSSWLFLSSWLLGFLGFSAFPARQESRPENPELHNTLRYQSRLVRFKHTRARCLLRKSPSNRLLWRPSEPTPSLTSSRCVLTPPVSPLPGCELPPTQLPSASKPLCVLSCLLPLRRQSMANAKK